MQPGAHHFAYAEVPLVMFVAVLALGTDIGDLLGHSRGSFEDFPAQSVPTRAAIGLGPDGAGDELEQLRLAGAVAADQQPALPGPDPPRHPAQHGPVTAIEIDAVEGDGDV